MKTNVDISGLRTDRFVSSIYIYMYSGGLVK